MSEELAITNPFRTLPTTFRLDRTQFGSILEDNKAKIQIQNLWSAAQQAGLTVVFWVDVRTDEECITIKRPE